MTRNISWPRTLGLAMIAGVGAAIIALARRDAGQRTGYVPHPDDQRRQHAGAVSVLSDGPSRGAPEPPRQPSRDRATFEKPRKDKSVARSMRLRSRLGIALEGVVVRHPDEDEWDPLRPASGSETITVSVLPGSHVSAEGHIPTVVDVGGSELVLVPDASLSLLWTGGRDQLQSWRIADESSGVEATDTEGGGYLEATLGRATAAGAFERGLGIAADVQLLAEALGPDAVLSIPVALRSGYEIEATWKPVSGVHVIEELPATYAAAPPGAALPVRLMWSDGRLAEMPCELRVRRWPAREGELYSRDWGQYRVRHGVANGVWQVEGSLELADLLLEGEYCATAFAIDGSAYGRSTFIHDGTGIEITMHPSRRIAGVVRFAGGHCPPADTLGVSVEYGGQGLERVWNWSGKVRLDPEGRFETAITPPPKANPAIPLHPPATGTVRLSAPGYHPWSTDVRWGDPLALLGTVMLHGDEPDLRFVPLASDSEEEWYSVFAEDWRRERLIQSALVCGEYVFLELERDDDDPELFGKASLLVSRGPRLDVISGIVTEGGNWAEVPRASYGLRVAPDGEIPLGQSVAVGIEWRGVRIMFGYFDRADFATEELAIDFEGPAEGLHAWSYRREGGVMEPELRWQLRPGVVEIAP